ncbi:hypothetical protein THAOC_07721 [Thalassiosira oceanica]|uniref:rRNA biogenesis protein RRP36 n=1 Tax=Thalassiosira oceanica TaxID=159749 RepID=K0SWU2_THAOC|nr:hypothetical protein THAOC_07721 [Thalassiosira oceanica]|eukprot:EJK70888.1 hypothetical protein THAOC_07721 [Thalassiosira oceanica]
MNDLASSSSSGESSSDSEDAPEMVSHFDDLPTDDSDSEGEGEDGVHGGSSESDCGGSESSERNLPLADRIARAAGMGRKYTKEAEDRDFDGGKKRRVERRSRALTVASRRLREARMGNGDAGVDDQVHTIDESTEINKKSKKSKHKPTEMSSKRRDYFSRGRPDLNSAGLGVSVGAKKYKARDPRMVSLSGHLDADVFEKRFGFLDDIQDNEIDNLKMRVHAWKQTGKRGQKARKKLGITVGEGSLEDDREELTRLLQERAERKRARVVRAAKRSVKQKLREDVASGKRAAYYPKRSELRRMEVEAKFEEIRKRGGDDAVDKAIAKRRKKNVAKSHKLMPSHMI